jgi:Fe2+ transport system protein FeoA
MTTLDCIDEGGKCFVSSVNISGKMRCRLYDLGFVKNTAVECIKKNKTICAYQVRGTVIALHNDTSALVSVRKI